MTYGVDMTLEKGRRIVRGLGFYNTRPVKNIREIVKNSARTMGSKTGFIYKKDGNVIRKTYRDLDHDVDFVGTALVDMGFKGKKIAILSENRYEWPYPISPLSTEQASACPWINTFPARRLKT